MDWTPGLPLRLCERHDLPFVRADSNGLVVEFNQRFETIYGWDTKLVGQTIGLILPQQFRELHHAGFARFKLTEKSEVVNHPLELATICADGSVIRSEHFIVAEKDDEEWLEFCCNFEALGGPPWLLIIPTGL